MDARRMVPRGISTIVNFAYEELACEVNGRGSTGRSVLVGKGLSSEEDGINRTGDWRRHSPMTTVRWRGRTSV